MARPVVHSAVARLSAHRTAEGPGDGGADVVYLSRGMDWTPHITRWTLSMRAAGLSAETIKLRTYHLERAAREVGVAIAAVTALDLEAWLGSQGWSRSTLRSFRSSLRRFFAWAQRAGVVDIDPAHELPAPRPVLPRPHPTPEIIWRDALTRADDDERLMIRLAAEAGLRRGEVARVHERDVIEDLVGYSLIVHGKGDKERTVPLSDSLARAVLRRIRERGRDSSRWLFPGQVDGHISARWVGKRVSRLLPEGWSMHSLRHRFGTAAYAVDGDLLAVQQLLGHASPATTQVYVQVPDAARRRLVEAVAA